MLVSVLELEPELDSELELDSVSVLESELVLDSESVLESELVLDSELEPELVLDSALELELELVWPQQHLLSVMVLVKYLEEDLQDNFLVVSSEATIKIIKIIRL